MKILGISAYYHDSAASLIVDGKIISAAQEERFTRKKHDSSFPRNAIQFCINESNIQLSDLDYIVFYEKPLIKFERLLETYISFAPKGFKSFLMAMPVWLKEKLYLKSVLKKELINFDGVDKSNLPDLLFSQHHLSHAASAFFPSPFNKAAVLCLDGVGEWSSSTVWIGEDNNLIPKWEIHFPHSLGLLYSAFTYFTGFKVNSGEYKLMGLAPYGEPKYYDLILENLIDLKEDGTFKLDMSYFNYAVGLTMTSKKFNKLFNSEPRKPEEALTQHQMDIAASIQKVTEEVVIRLCKTIKKEFDVDYLCLAGGVALNCVANGKLLRSNIFKDIWIQPAAGDAGGALGAAQSVWYQYLNNSRTPDSPDSMRGSYLGSIFDDEEIKEVLDSYDAKYEIIQDDHYENKVANILADGKVVGWMQGAMEFGPRALGSRSILGDPRNEEMQTTMNLKIKYRESFRPFAPIILDDEVNNFFEHEGSSPYMLIVADIKKELRKELDDKQKQLFGIDKLKIPRSTLPAITHVDYSARLQTVHNDTNPKMHKLLKEFKKVTNCPVLVNTSFNVRGEPIVNTPEDAYRCFMRTEMDYLAIGGFLLNKTDQPEWESDDWQDEFELD
ncbi:carbamoyltransferase [SAR86 cluster bacterium]|nr:carbamoyltransferase [SAR86 cluster bacterium]